MSSTRTLRFGPVPPTTDVALIPAAELATLRAELATAQAEANGIGRKFGHVWTFTAADVARLKALHRGGYKPRKAPATTEEPTP